MVLNSTLRITRLRRWWLWRSWRKSIPTRSEKKWRFILRNADVLTPVPAGSILPWSGNLGFLVQMSISSWRSIGRPRSYWQRHHTWDAYVPIADGGNKSVEHPCGDLRRMSLVWESWWSLPNLRSSLPHPSLLIDLLGIDDQEFTSHGKFHPSCVHSKRPGFVRGTLLSFKVATMTVWATKSPLQLLSRFYN